jgi:2',3'-cyclic-nucleotide 2'-phosphodiesterase (5'-nucleotidase family)
VGTDFATFGNHDFDVGVDPLLSVVDRAPQTWLATNLGAPTEASRWSRPQ